MIAVGFVSIDKNVGDECAPGALMPYRCQAADGSAWGGEVMIW